MRKVAVRVRIGRAVEDVYAYATTVDTMPEWRGDISEAEQLADGPIGVGTRIRAGGKVLGRPIGIVIEVTELEPGARFGYRPVSGPSGPTTSTPSSPTRAAPGSPSPMRSS